MYLVQFFFSLALDLWENICYSFLQFFVLLKFQPFL
uniref:Uncharacterized protein n=1 Tax=Rhizophora mucronata TaxID=61149 RepID=A0A2P2Q208_RHIMU